MRNWNSEDDIKAGKTPKSFYPTYEELKLKICQVVLVSFLCFYPTYEELKYETRCKGRII